MHRRGSYTSGREHGRRRAMRAAQLVPAETRRARDASPVQKRADDEQDGTADEAQLGEDAMEVEVDLTE